MQYIISVLWISLELLYGLIFLAAFLPLRKTRKQVVGWFVIAWAFMCFYSNTDIDELVKPIVTISVLTAVSVFAFDGAWVIHVFLATISYIFIAIIDTAISYGASAIMGISLHELIWRKFTYIIVGTVSKLLEVLFAWVLLRIRSRKGLRSIHLRWMILTLLFPIVSVVMLIVIFLNSQDNEDLSIGAVIYSGILAAANIAILYIVHSIEGATKREQDMVLLRQQMEFQTESYIALEKNYGIQRKATHEFERHLHTLRDLMDREEYQTAYNYVQQLQNNRTLRIFNVNSHHPVVDVILNQKYQDARDNSINMQIKVNDLSKVKMQNDALVVLLANLLDNAIEACQKVSSRREIHCSIYADDLLYIAIRNTSPSVKIIDGGITTTKSSQEEHGYGIPAIRYILDQLKAEYTFEYCDGWFQFAAEIPIEITERQH